MAEKNKELHCSFCGKSENQVHRMIQGPGVRICDECVQLCMSILEDDYSLSLIHISRSKQWVPVDSTLELLDTPGMLWPKFEDVNVGMHLAFTGAIKDCLLYTSRCV